MKIMQDYDKELNILPKLMDIQTEISKNLLMMDSLQEAKKIAMIEILKLEAQVLKANDILAIKKP